jgi:CRP-like cAMP-binding protein
LSGQHTILSFKSGEEIYKEGDPASAFYIILEGTVKTSRSVPISQLDRQNLGSGDFFAAVSLLTSREHDDTAVAKTDVSLIAIQKNQFQDIAETNKPIALKILKDLSSLIRTLNATLMGRTAEAVAAAMKEETTPKNYSVNDSNVRCYDANSVIFREGDDSNEEILIIKKGIIKITKTVGGDEITLAYLKDGEIFGEMGVLESQPRSANAYAYETCEIVALNDAQVITQPQIFLKLCILLANRTWFLIKQVTNRRIKDPVERLCDMLVINLKKENIASSIRGHTFPFSIKQLSEMSGLPPNDGLAGIKALTNDGLVKVDKDHIHIKSTVEIYRRNEVYWKLAR